MPYVFITCEVKVLTASVPADRKYGDNVAIEVFGGDFAEYYFCHSDI